MSTVVVSTLNSLKDILRILKLKWQPKNSDVGYVTYWDKYSLGRYTNLLLLSLKSEPTTRTSVDSKVKRFTKTYKKVYEVQLFLCTKHNGSWKGDVKLEYTKEPFDLRKIKWVLSSLTIELWLIRNLGKVIVMRVKKKG